MITERVRATEIEPSLYAADFSRLGEQVEELMDAGARVFHYDVGDGQFVEPITIGPIVLESIAPLIHARGGILDCHLMVIEPERQFAQIAAAGGHSVTFHIEATDDPADAIRLARQLGLGAGIAFNPETPVEEAVAAAEGVDLVLCMCIHPGYSARTSCPSHSSGSPRSGRCSQTGFRCRWTAESRSATSVRSTALERISSWPAARSSASGTRPVRSPA